MQSALRLYYITMTEIHKALDQINEIHRHLARSELYRGARSFPVAATGVLSLLAAAFQTSVLGRPPTAISFVYYWVGVAGLSALLTGGTIVYNYFYRDNPRERRQSRQMVAQFVPSITAGTIVTLVIAVLSPEAIVLLPGLWTILYALALFAARPHLPRMIGWTALLYLMTGGLLLIFAAKGAALNPWGMGLTFGLGQILIALALYWNLERKKDV